MNEAIHNFLIEKYNSLTYTHNYVFGYVAEGMVYGAVVENADSLLPYITSIDRASQKNGGTYQLKYKPNKAQLELIKSKASKIQSVCSEDLLTKTFMESKHNRGQIFEKMVANALNGYQVEKANAKFTDCGDIIVNGTHYQVKYLKATFTDERTLKNLGA